LGTENLDVDWKGNEKRKKKRAKYVNPPEKREIVNRGL
jgi:hypothetical protein